MEFLAVDLHQVIVEAVDSRLGTAPLVARRPELAELPQPFLVDAVAPRFDTFLGQPTVIRDLPANAIKRRLWNPERDRLRLAGRREAQTEQR